MRDYFADVERLGTYVIRLRFGQSAPQPGILSTREVHALWKDNADFCRLFSQTLADMPFDAFFWERRLCGRKHSTHHSNP